MKKIYIYKLNIIQKKYIYIYYIHTETTQINR